MDAALVNESWYWNCSGKDDFRSYPVYSDGIVTAGKALTTATAILSIFGCSLIMFTYIAYKELRTKARAMLFHLSIADIVVVTSHLAGFYENYIWYLQHPDAISNSYQHNLCISQAAFLVFGSVASLMWSTAVGLFMVVLSVNTKQWENINRAVYVTSCIACWLVPLIISVSMAALKLFGFVLVGATSKTASISIL